MASDEYAVSRSLGSTDNLSSFSSPRLTEGAVLGIDVGYSATRATTGLCLLRWDASTISCRITCTRTDETSRNAAIRCLVSNLPLLAVAIDGPLTRDLRLMNSYRAAESLLSLGTFQKRGKPGQTNSPTGQLLHQHATALARLALTNAMVGRATHRGAIHERAVVEAFPNLFLGVLHPDAGYPERPLVRRNWTDTLFPLVSDRLKAMVAELLPGRSLSNDAFCLTDHEHVAALVCALSALCLAGDRYVAVGADDDGYIVLPPLDYWGRDPSGGVWADVALRNSLEDVRRRFPGARIIP